MRRAVHSSRGVQPSVVCVTECDREASVMKRPWPTRDRCATGRGEYLFNICTSLLM